MENVYTYSHLCRDCCLDKSQRENIRWIALALVWKKKQQNLKPNNPFSKNDFCDPRTQPKNHFLKGEKDWKLNGVKNYNKNFCLWIFLIIEKTYLP